MTFKLLTRLALTATTATLAATSVVLTALPEAAGAATVTRTINGTSYDISTVTGSFNNLQSTLTDTPWWNNRDLAGQFAAEVGVDLGDPNFRRGPFFAYDTAGVEVRFRTWGFPGGFLPGGGLLDGLGAVGENTFAVATPTAATPIPTPALLPGVVGLGIATYRKRKLASSTTA